MELDKRIEALTDILSVTAGCHDWELMTKKGYFANSIFDFKDLKRLCVYGEYAGWREHNQCFLCKQAGDETYYSYFLPEGKLLHEEPEKKYRAFSLNEFLEKYDVGDLVKIRRNGYEEVEHAMFTGYVTGPDESGDKNLGEYQIIIGGMRYSFAYLFEYYELFFMGHWQPFGIIDEDKE